MTKLVFTSGSRSGERLEVESELTIGREGVDVTIDDPKASRRHAAVRRRGEGLEIEDLGSSNGTFLNGRRVEGTRALGAGDVIQIGDTALEVEVEVVAGETVLRNRHEAATAPTAFPPAVAAPAAAPAPSAAPVPARPFVEAASAPRRRGRAASRRIAPTLFAFAAIGATAGALVIYFAMR